MRTCRETAHKIPSRRTLEVNILWDYNKTWYYKTEIKGAYYETRNMSRMPRRRAWQTSCLLKGTFFVRHYIVCKQRKLLCDIAHVMALHILETFSRSRWNHPFIYNTKYLLRSNKAFILFEASQRKFKWNIFSFPHQNDRNIWANCILCTNYCFIVPLSMPLWGPSTRNSAFSVYAATRALMARPVQELSKYTPSLGIE